MSEINKHYFQFPQDYKTMSETDKDIALTELANEILDQLVSLSKGNK
ncbi:MAG: hypothetical protein NTU55_00365 [Actinobacteria bacterium]|nr:hypothetical protein [Actinomycetota bacterium]